MCRKQPRHANSSDIQVSKGIDRGRSLPYLRLRDGNVPSWDSLVEVEMMTRDDLIREVRSRGGNLPTLLVVYLAIVATMAGTAMAII